MALSEEQTQEETRWANQVLNEYPDMLMDAVQEAADGCQVEPDGTCPHGYRSPALVLGII